MKKIANWSKKSEKREISEINPKLVNKSENLGKIEKKWQTSEQKSQTSKNKSQTSEKKKKKKSEKNVAT